MRKKVPIDFQPTVHEMAEKFFAHRGEVLGWCLLCDSPIRTEQEFIPGTDTHNCQRGRDLEASTARSQQAEQEDGQGGAGLMARLAGPGNATVRPKFRKELGPNFPATTSFSSL
jgi:hypothetical protein